MRSCEIFLITCLSLLLATTATAVQKDGKPESESFSVQDAVAGEWRGESDRVRDKWRHPVEVLTFFGLEPGMTVVEVYPGGGWYTKILAPYVNRTGGKYIAANSDPADETEYVQRGLRAFKKNYIDRPEIYGPIDVTVVGSESSGIAPDGSADLVLTFRNVHNLVPAGVAEEIFAGFFSALRPGGVLGVVDHRLPEDRKADEDLSTGYVHESVVVSLAEQAGFVLEADTPINSNPSDTADYPFGVWTLPPTSLTAPYGSPVDPDFDRAPYDAIGESDRFTLRFRKPKS